MSLQKFEAYMAAYAGTPSVEAPLHIGPEMGAILKGSGALAIAGDHKVYAGVWEVTERITNYDGKLLGYRPAHHILLGDSQPQTSVVVCKDYSTNFREGEPIAVSGPLPGEDIFIDGGQITFGGVAMRSLAPLPS